MGDDESAAVSSRRRLDARGVAWTSSPLRGVGLLVTGCCCEWDDRGVEVVEVRDGRSLRDAGDDIATIRWVYSRRVVVGGRRRARGVVESRRSLQDAADAKTR